MSTDDETETGVERAAERIFEAWYMVEDAKGDETPLSPAETVAYQEGLLRSLEILTDECDVDHAAPRDDRDQCDRCGRELVQMLGGKQCPRCR